MMNTDMEISMRNKRTSHKSFVICKKGNSYIPIRVADLFLFFHHAGLTFTIDRHGNKYIADKSLAEFEGILDNNIFFRVNRRLILNINVIKEFKTISFGKVLIELKHADWYKEDIIVSQVNSPLFKKWIHNL